MQQHTNRVALVLAVPLLFSGISAHCQTNGTINVEVSDSSGIVVGGAHVKVVNSVTGATQETSVNSNGNYSLNGTETGIYAISITARGFQPFAQKGIHVTGDQVVSIKAILQTALPSPPTGWMHDPAERMSRSTLTGDWGGERSKLNRMGITPWGNYVGESATMVSGGLRKGSNYTDDMRLAFDLDLGKLVEWRGTHFHFALDDRHGTSTSVQDIVSNKLNVQEIYGAGENRRFSELSFDQDLANGVVNLKAGWYVMGDDFAREHMLCSFENLGFCAHAQSLPNDSTWTDWPTAEWGFRVQVNLRRDLYARVAVYEGNATYKQPKNGMKFSFNGATGAIMPTEFGYTSSLGADKLPGHYKLGAYYDTSRAKDQATSAFSHDGRYGVWLIGDQEVTSFEQGTKRGLFLFGEETLADHETSPMTSWELLAALAQGPFSWRKTDYINFGYIHAGVNSRAIGAEAEKLASSGVTDFPLAHGEAVFEEGYGAMVTGWWLIHPNFQYVVDPGAFSFKHIPNPWVFGVQTKITF
jgi:porin